MKKFLKLAWRNIWRNRRRSLLTLSMLSVGLALFIFTWSFADGFHDEMIKNAVETQMGHIEIHKKGFLNNPVLKNHLPDPGRIMRITASLPDVAAFAPRVKSTALASTAYASNNVSIIGIEPPLEKKLTIIGNKLIKGKYLTKKTSSEAMIGDSLANKLKLDIGDKIIVMGQGLDGELYSDALKVSGIYHTSDLRLDKYTLYMRISDAQDFFKANGYVNEVAIRLKNENRIDKVVGLLKGRINDPGIEVLSWRQVDPGLVQFIVVDNWGLYIMIFIVVMIIGLEVYNTLLMSILERTREFGVLLAIGTKPGQIVLMVLAEAFWMALVMIILGCLVGGLSSLYFVYHPVDFSLFASGFELFSVSSLIHFSLGWWHLVYSSLIMFVLVMLASIFPAVKAARLKPVEALEFQ